MRSTAFLFYLLTSASMMLAQNPVPGATQIVYDNTTNNLTPFGDYLPRIAYGDEVRLGGTARRLTRLEFLILASGPNATVPAEIELVIWRPGPFQFQPGTVIWRSGFQSFTFPTGVTSPLEFDLPRIRVPDQMVWTLQFRGYEPYVEEPELFAAGPATTGDDDVPEPGYWIFNPLARRWFYQNIGYSSFYCRITAEDAGASVE